ncbi:MAG: putative DNA binding domain-containing protein [Caldilineales bacterium]|nr:putative DNA binding domain-containing protein [Caldilineales bacterium]MDW8318456.1 putative DNA binding domain-containing protein [Anaerolineae bacterium]
MSNSNKKKKNRGKRQWWKMDLHLHTPASSDWLEPGVTWLDWLHKAEQRGLDIVAITDHNTVAGIARLRQEIERLQWLEREGRLRPQERRDLDEYRRLGNELLVLPGFEFTATFGFHILAIFPPETTVRQLEFILLQLNVPPDKLDLGSTEVGPTTDVLTAYRIIRQAGGLVIAAHANSTHGVAMRDFPFGGQTKIAYTQDLNLHALEVTDLESRSPRATARFFNGSKPEYPRRMMCIQGSDAHRLTRDPKDANRLGIGDRVTEIRLSEPSFEEIKEVLESGDVALVRPYRRKDEPFDFVAAAREQGPSIVQSFHERLGRPGGRQTAILTDVVAFANTLGGTVYVGASAKPGPPVGVENVNETIAELRDLIERKITPQLDVEIDALESQGRQVVRIRVPEGADKPYCLDNSRIYVRHEAESELAVRDEIVQVVRRALIQRGELVPAAPAEGALETTARNGGRKGRGEKRGIEKAQPAPALATQPQLPPLVAEAIAAPEAEPVAPSSDGQPAEPGEAPVAEAAPTVPPPKVGVQIVGVADRGGTRYYAIRDLRNGNIVQNVTRKSARRLWRYAIAQHESFSPTSGKITWSGDIGLFRVEKRAGKQRYDFVQRLPDGTVVVYYGVTEEGCEGPWRQFLVGEDADTGGENGE